jgi:hypothetical protein
MKIKSTVHVIVWSLLSLSTSVYATAQRSDSFIFKGESYSLIGKTDGEFANPRQFGMTPKMMSTACYRGYYASYELNDAGLYLRKLTLREKDKNYLPVAGVNPVINTNRYQATYTNLNVAVEFTGKIRLANGFIRELYIHMGYQKPTAFKTVFDITLKDGRVVEVKDRSEEMEAKRGEFKKRFESGELRQSIEESFSLDMKLE